MNKLKTTLSCVLFLLFATHDTLTAQGFGADSLRLRNSSGGSSWFSLSPSATLPYRLIFPPTLGSNSNQLFYVNGTTGQISVLAPGTNGQALQMSGAALAWVSPASSMWSLTGNTGLNPSTDFLGTTDAQPLIVRTNNVERLRVLSNGNVGIGTSNAAERLHLGGGNVLLDTASSGVASQLQFMNPARTFKTIFQAGAQSSNLSYTLPTIAPTVGQFLSSDASGVLSWSSALTSSTGWALSGNNTTTSWDGSSGSFLGTTSARPLVIATTNATAQDIRFFTGTSGANERVRISASGNVGIGTTNPGVTLDVGGELRTSNSRTQSVIRTLPTTVNDAVDIGSFLFTNGGGALWISLIVPSSGFSVSKSYVIPINYSQTGGVWQQVQTTNTTSSYGANDVELDIMVSGGTASLRIRRSGGSTAGTAYVAIRQDGVNTDTFTASSAVTTVTPPSTILFAPAASTDWHITGNAIASSWNGSSGNYVGSSSAFPLVLATTNATAQDIRFFTGASGANERMRISSTGNIGVGTSNAAERLHLGGGNLLLDTASSGVASQLQFMNPARTFKTIFQAGAQSSNLSYTLPAIAPTVGQFLSSDASGVLSWSSALTSSTGWALSGNNTTTSWDGSSGSFLGTTSARPLVIATTNATAQDIRFFTGTSGANERVRISASGNVGI